MRWNKKINAVTLSEMITVLILTSIVVGLAFTVLGLVQNHMKAISSNYNKNLELKKLETSLWLDFNRYSHIYYDPLDSELSFKNEIDSVSYTFYKEYVVKVKDTFPITVVSNVFYFDGKETKDSKVDAIKLVTDKVHSNEYLIIYKTNTANNYMN